MVKKNVYSDKDTMDINELASLNDDISPELIEQLQQQLTQQASAIDENEQPSPPKVPFNVNDDTTLFEEPTPPKTEQEAPPKKDVLEDVKVKEPETPKPETPKTEPPVQEKKNVNISQNFDDNFIKKYKAKLNKQKVIDDREKKYDTQSSISSAAFSENENQGDEESIEAITKGNITEKPITPQQKEYNDSLDFLDGNVKYSKYVIYIEPQNIEFIDSLTVKERKNLINRILKEQEDISVTKKKLKLINVIIKHVIVAILTVAISIPVVYWTINASLEATINNYRNSQTIFKTLYRENGKITNTSIKK